MRALVLVALLTGAAEASPTLSRLFDRFDADRDGKLARREWEGLVSGPDRFIDSDGNGSIDRVEFARSFLTVHSWTPSDRSLLYDRDVKECEGLLANGYVQEAEKKAREAVASYPESSIAWAALAKVLERYGRLKEARETFRKALELEPGNEKSLAAWAVFLLRNGPQTEAEKALTAALEAVEVRHRLFAYGVRKAPEEDLAESQVIGFLDHFLNARRDAYRTLELVAWAEKRLGKRPRLAGFELQAKLALGDSAGAMAQAAKGIEEGFGPFWMLSFQGRALAAQGKRSEAVASFRKALLQPDVTNAEGLQTMLDLFAALSESGDASSAEQFLRLRILPVTTTPASRRHLARYLARCKRPKDAIEQLKESLSASPVDPSAWKELADLLGLVNDRAGRRKALQAALERCGERTGLAQELKSALAAQ